MTVKGFHFKNSQIGSISSRADKSIGYRISTGELNPEQMAAFFPLQGQNVEVFIKPHDIQEVEYEEVESEVDEKTPSQKLRRVLHVLWTQQGAKGDFRIWYADQITKIIDRIKDKLD